MAKNGVTKKEHDDLKRETARLKQRIALYEAMTSNEVAGLEARAVKYHAATDQTAELVDGLVGDLEQLRKQLTKFKRETAQVQSTIPVPNLSDTVEDRLKKANDNLADVLVDKDGELKRVEQQYEDLKAEYKQLRILKASLKVELLELEDRGALSTSLRKHLSRVVPVHSNLLKPADQAIGFIQSAKTDREIAKALLTLVKWALVPVREFKGQVDHLDSVAEDVSVDNVQAALAPDQDEAAAV